MKRLCGHTVFCSQYACTCGGAYCLARASSKCSDALLDAVCGSGVCFGVGLPLDTEAKGEVCYRFWCDGRMPLPASGLRV
ncbi:hypothetical protein NPIL_409501 [Nephila pilipes]|uniref:Uncharacterized protein n=1 Tax=Nephila pilipes TaxID=299642 RepID=A0A8X6UTD2_NEPPI|nr:hypothetical protein NPIL_409501 [Nephila pilipes]